MLLKLFIALVTLLFPVNLDWFDDDEMTEEEYYTDNEDSFEFENDGYYEVTLEKKFKDFQAGGFTLPLQIPASANISRWVWDLSRVSLGVDSNNRIGHTINVHTVSVRWAIHLDSTGLMQGLNYNAVEYRVFVYVDKTKAWNTYPSGISGNNNGGTFQAGGFLKTDRMQSFYDLDNIQRYRILYDSGLQTIQPTKGMTDLRWGQAGAQPWGNAVPFNLGQVIWNPTARLTTVMYNGDVADDQLTADSFSQNFTIGMTQEAPGGIGVLDGGIVSIGNELTFDSVRGLTSGPSDGTTPMWAAQGFNQNMALIEMFRPFPNTVNGDFTHEFKTPLAVDYQADVELDNGYAIRGGLVLGIIFFNNAFSTRFTMDGRITYTDD